MNWSKCKMSKKVFAPEKIISIKREFVSDVTVYDLGVEIDHNYCAEGIAVHNCITETNAMFNNGYLAMLKPGQYVVGVSMPDACDTCLELIDGKVYRVRGTPAEDYSNLDPRSEKYIKLAEIWGNEVWVGKNNYGRSASARKRIDPTVGNKESNLREKHHHEHSMPACPNHSNCRCRWVHINPEYQYVNKENQIKLRVENEDEWEEWYNDNIKQPQGGTA